MLRCFYKIKQQQTKKAHLSRHFLWSRLTLKYYYLVVPAPLIVGSRLYN